MARPHEQQRRLEIVSVSRRLCSTVSKLRFGPGVSHVYNPLEYAREPHERYLEKYGQGRKRLLFVGMNPGPFGMAQTGVPFGDVRMVRDFLKVEGFVGKPPNEHPKRPVLGFECQRSEVSGTRLWGFVQERFPDPKRFFRNAFVANYCPLCFMEASGKNRTPDQLPSEEKAELFECCDRALRELIVLCEAELVIGIGGFAEQRAKAACTGIENARVISVLHPSPANPRANRGWAAEVDRDLRAAKITLE